MKLKVGKLAHFLIFKTDSKVGKLAHFLIFKTDSKVGNFAHLEKLVRIHHLWYDIYADIAVVVCCIVRRA